MCDLEKSGSLPALPVLHSAQSIAADKRMHCDSFRNTRGGGWGAGSRENGEVSSGFSGVKQKRQPPDGLANG